MTPAKIDIKLDAYLSQGVDTTANLKITHPVGLRVVEAAHWLMDDTLTSYKAARAKAKNKRRDAKRATSQIAHVTARAVGWFSLAYNDFHARKWELRNGSPASAQQFESELATVLDGLSPSSFPKLGVDRMVEVIDLIVEFAEEVFGPNYAPASEARVINAELKAARTERVTKTSELRLAMTELKASRRFARRNYSAARRMVSAALELEDYDDIFSVMRPLNSIYRTSKQGAPDDEDAELNGPEEKVEEKVEEEGEPAEQKVEEGEAAEDVEETKEPQEMEAPASTGRSEQVKEPRDAKAEPV